MTAPESSAQWCAAILATRPGEAHEFWISCVDRLVRVRAALTSRKGSADTKSSDRVTRMEVCGATARAEPCAACALLAQFRDLLGFLQ